MYFITLVSALRIRELLPKLGFVWVGCIFSTTILSIDHLAPMFEAGVIAFVCGLSVFSFNSYAGYKTDLINERLRNLGGIPKKHYLFVGLVATLLGLFSLLSLWDQRTIFGMVVLVLWHMYSMKDGLKSIPFGGLAVAYLTQLIQFGFGYLYFKDNIDMEGFILASLFGSLVAGGHMIHECIDLKADKSHNFRTTAVSLGFQKGLWVSWICFISALIHLPLLFALTGTVLKVSVLTLPALLIVVLHPAFIPAFRDLFLFRRLYLGAMTLAISVYVLLTLKM